MSLRTRAPGARWFDPPSRYKQALAEEKRREDQRWGRYQFIAWDMGYQPDETRIVRAEQRFGEHVITAEDLANTPTSDEALLEALEQYVARDLERTQRMLNLIHWGDEGSAWWRPHLRDWPRGRIPRKLKKRMRSRPVRFTWGGNVTTVHPSFQGRLRSIAE